MHSADDVEMSAITGAAAFTTIATDDADGETKSRERCDVPAVVDGMNTIALPLIVPVVPDAGTAHLAAASASAQK